MDRRIKEVRDELWWYTALGADPRHGCFEGAVVDSSEPGRPGPVAEADDITLAAWAEAVEKRHVDGDLEECTVARVGDVGFIGAAAAAAAHQQ